MVEIDIPHVFLDVEEPTKRWQCGISVIEILAKKYQIIQSLMHLRVHWQRMFISNTVQAYKTCRNVFVRNRCIQATYEHQKALIDAERIELQEAIEKNSAKNTEDVKIFDSLLEITASAKRIMNSLIISKKRALLNLILSNATLNGTSLCFFP